MDIFPLGPVTTDIGMMVAHVHVYICVLEHTCMIEMMPVCKASMGNPINENLTP